MRGGKEYRSQNPEVRRQFEWLVVRDSSLVLRKSEKIISSFIGCVMRSIGYCGQKEASGGVEAVR